MSANQIDENSIIEDLAAIFRHARGRRGREARIALFESLSALEKQAYVRGASDKVLGQLAESRFLAGILREAASPVRYQSVRGARQLWTITPDIRVSHEPA